MTFEYEYVPEHRCENDKFTHNYFCQTCSAMQGYPDEEGTWVDDDDWIKSWVENHLQWYGNKAFKFINSRPEHWNKGFFLEKDSMGLYKMWPGWQHLKDNEGYFYLRSGGKEWLIRCNDIYATYEKIMRFQDELFREEGIQPMRYKEDL